jgi:hypothetical protein
MRPSRKTKPTPTLTNALELARQAPPEHNEAIAIQVGRMIASDASNLTRGVLFLSSRDMSNAAIAKALGAASKRPATPRTACAAIAKLIDAPIVVRPVKASKNPFGVDLLGKPISRRNTSELEDAVQARVIATLDKSAAPNVYYFHPANGGFRSMRTAVRLKAQGVKPGTPDLILIIAGRMHALELKRERGGTVSAVQKQARLDIIAAGGVHAVARGYDEAIATLTAWGAIR